MEQPALIKRPTIKQPISKTETGYRCVQFQNGICALIGQDCKDNKCGPSEDGLIIAAGKESKAVDQ